MDQVSLTWSFVNICPMMEKLLLQEGCYEVFSQSQILFLEPNFSLYTIFTP